MKIVSWNVLHIVHEFNHAFDESPVLTKYELRTGSNSNEQVRLTEIVATIGGFVSDETIVCLQEVPGDLLVMLREIPGVQVLTHRYERVPQLKAFDYGFYRDPSEYLVTVVPDSMDVRGTDTIVFAEPGKACLVVVFRDLMVMNVHVPFGSSRHLAAVRMLVDGIPPGMEFVVVGDFNMSASRLGRILDEFGCRGRVVEMDRDTRKVPGRGTSRIDHGLVSETLLVSDKFVSENLDMSDHASIGFSFSSNSCSTAVIPGDCSDSR